MAFVLTIVMIPMYIAVIFIPYWTRKTESFGVSIPESAFQHPRFKKMRKQYVLMTSILAIVVSIVFLISSGYSEETASILYPLLIILFIIGSFFIYIPFHQLSKEVKQENKSWFKKQQIVAVDTRFRGEKLTHSNLWFIIGFAISVATIILTLIFYDRLPNQIPMQYNFKGEVTNWTEKTYRSAFLFPIIQIYLTLLFVFVNTVISKAKQQIDVANPNESIRKNMIFRKRWSRFTIVMGISTVLLFTFVQLSLLFSFPSTIISIVTFVFTIGVIGWAILLSITTGQGGSRIRSKNSHQNESVTEEQILQHDDDQYWKLGIFYFNKNDPSIFIEKRFGIGWTNNWAHPLSWIIFGGIIFIAIAITWWATL